MRVKKAKKVYVSFHKMNIDGSRTGTFAIGCPNEETALACASEIASIVGFRYVRINYTGRFPQGASYIPYDEYLDGSYLKRKEA